MAEKNTETSVDNIDIDNSEFETKTDENELDDVKIICPDCSLHKNPNYAIKNKNKCMVCSKELCQKHYETAIYWAKHYRPFEKEGFSMCDQCCWWEIS